MARVRRYGGRYILEVGGSYLYEIEDFISGTEMKGLIALLCS